MIIKQAIRLGNSAGVILPRSWEHKKVKVELIEDSIVNDILEILKENNFLSDVIGIYLAGSYARGEEVPDSDIDILVITGNTNRLLKKNQYEILLISKEKFDSNIKKNLYLYSIIKESKTILNSSLIEEYKKEKFFLSLNKINEISSIMKINNESVKLAEKTKNNIRDGIAYSVVLRLRELYLIECILNNKRYTNKGFLRIIIKNSSAEVFEAYKRIKNDLRPKNNIKPEEIKNLIKYSENILKSIQYAKKK